ncbi:hypothetical protein F4778DRAFT_797375 [Xylariomycetidae sp. FL2044]|nr:hypothetical protein F4778DRAFT_797375 [Xylariomycetidae sp. FL2044]
MACIACAFTGVGAMNRTLQLPGNEGYQQQGLFYFFLFEVFYCINIIPVKLSIALMLLRIAQGRKVYIATIWATIGLFTTMNLIAGFYIIFHCNPVAAAWDLSLLENGSGRCNDASVLVNIYYATTAVNIFSDWLTAFLPIPLLWGVHMNRNSKVSVAFILGLGFFASLSACVRLKYTVNLTEQENYLFAISDIVIWGYAENGLGLIAGCLAVLKPLFRRAFALDSKPTTTPTTGRYGFPSNARATYENFGCKDAYEMDISSTLSPRDGDNNNNKGTGGGGGGGGGGKTQTVRTQIRRGRGGDEGDEDDVTSLDSLEGRGGGITVSRKVKVTSEPYGYV